MEKKDITWGTIIPLIGGFSLGAEEAIGKPPEFVGSYTGFWSNDQHYMNYQNKTLGRNVPYINFTEDTEFKQKVNIIVGVPPCAALSSLNSGRSATVKGAGCAKNEWMYMVIKDGIARCDADVIIIENAPALYTKKGSPVADQIRSIAQHNNRSVTLYRTSTHLHGIPQKRPRTFAVVWKNNVAPFVNYYCRDIVTWKEYLSDIKPDDLQQDMIINPKLVNEPYYNFIKNKTQLDPRDVLKRDNFTTCFNWVSDKGYLDEALEWFEKTDNELGAKFASHAKRKLADGMGIWDGSTHVFGDTINSVIGRNMFDSIHPTEERSLTVREAFTLMGFPKNFELLGGRKNINHIAQNVTTCSGRDIVLEAIKFLCGELELSHSDFVKQDNVKQRIDYESNSEQLSLNI